MITICLCNATPASYLLPGWWDIYWPTLALVVVGLVGTVIAVCTLLDIRRQTKNAENTALAAQKSAEAALLNAQALINAERAWIVVTVENVPGFSGTVITGESGDGTRSTSARFRLKYTNEGRTISWIDEKLVCLRIVNEDGLPKQPEFSAVKRLDRGPECLASKGAGYSDETIYADGHEQDGQMSIVLGMFNYRDTFGPHSTVFCFRITPDYKFERLAGHPSYNETI